MSRKGNPYDNAMAENFFSILKTECIYRHKPRSFQEANEMIDSYIHFYNHERIQTKTGVAPLIAAPLHLIQNISYIGAFVLSALIGAVQTLEGILHPYKMNYIKLLIKTKTLPKCPTFGKGWWAIKDSNLGPTGYEPVALTN